MTNEEIIKQYSDMGQRWLRGEIIVEEWQMGDKTIKLNPKQIEFVNAKDLRVLSSGGMGSGKTLAFLIKMVLLCLWFPNNRILLGKKTRQGIDLILLPDLFDLLPINMYSYKVQAGIITFFNGSEIILKGLDALQNGAGQDIKKAEQDIKGLNLGAYFIDQLEDIEERVYRALGDRMRLMAVPFRQACATTNPANFWAYDYFKANPRPNTRLIESSMLDNKMNLPEDFIADRLNNPENYVKRFVFGEWSPDVMTESSVFDKDYLLHQAFNTREPLREFNGIKIYAEPNKDHRYQIGVDPSEGAVDPCGIQVIDVDNGEQVAVFSGFVPLNVVSDKAVELCQMYSPKKKALLVIETGGGGTAVIENVKMRWNNIYERETFNYHQQINTKKLGFQTNHGTKKLLIDKFILLLKSKYVKIRDKATLEEMKVFIYSDEANQKGAGAQRGYHDDRIMSLMMAYLNIKPKTQEEKRLNQLLREKEKSNPKKYQYI
jgi:hypothetical protein